MNILNLEKQTVKRIGKNKKTNTAKLVALSYKGNKVKNKKENNIT